MVWAAGGLGPARNGAQHKTSALLSGPLHCVFVLSPSWPGADLKCSEIGQRGHLGLADYQRPASFHQCSCKPGLCRGGKARLTHRLSFQGCWGDAAKSPIPDGELGTLLPRCPLSREGDAPAAGEEARFDSQFLESSGEPAWRKLPSGKEGNLREFARTRLRKLPKLQQGQMWRSPGSPHSLGDPQRDGSP